MPNYDTGAIRNLLAEVFPDTDEIEFFCDDYFKEVKFEANMALKKRAHVLTQYCAQNDQLEKLLALVQKNFPAKYAELSATLLLNETPSTSAETATPESQQPSTRTPEPVASIQPTTLTSPVSTEGVEPTAKPQGQDVFISYSRKDLAFVTQLYQELTKQGISAWFDKEDIKPGVKWTASIVEGIRDCKVFLLVLSKGSTASDNVRKEVDLAQRYEKQILPLLWQSTDIPVAMEYQLAGIQWMEFKESASQENFNQLADVMQRLLGGITLAQATSDKPIAKESTIPPIQQKEELVPASGGLDFTFSKAKTVSAIALGGSVISSVITQSGLNKDQQDLVNGELKWLFNAVDNFLKIRKRQVDRSQSVPVEIPKTAQPPQGTNQLLSSLDDFDMQLWEGQLESMLTRIKTHLKNLDILLDREVKMGEAGKGDVYLQNQIMGGRLDIVKILQEMAQLMNQAYGIFVTSPEKLVQFLQQ